MSKRVYKKAISNCRQCPNLKTSHTPRTGDGEDWHCVAAMREIAGYIEWPSQEPACPPDWCPLELAEP